MKILVTTTLRCGSTWVVEIASRLTRRPNCYIQGADVGLSVLKPLSQEAVSRFALRMEKFEAEKGPLVMKTHDVPVPSCTALLNKLDDLLIINVKRDPADILVSRLMYCRYHRPAAGLPTGSAYVDSLGNASDEEMINGFFGVDDYHRWIREWAVFLVSSDHPRYFELAYEALHADPVKEIRRISYFLGQGSDRVSTIARNTSFDKMSCNRSKSRKLHEEVKTDHCRKGVVGDHKNYLSSSNLKRLNLDLASAMSNITVKGTSI